MNTLTYYEAFNLITEAYIKGELKVGDSKFCFCGTLCRNSALWTWDKPHNKLPYSYAEFGRMERALFSVDPKADWIGNGAVIPTVVANNENLLFTGMTAALEVLKQIHIERGEIIDEVPTFTKRQSATL